MSDRTHGLAVENLTEGFAAIGHVRGHPRRIARVARLRSKSHPPPREDPRSGGQGDIRRIGPLNVDQNWSAPMTSPPARVERELKTSASIVSLRNRTDPSQNTKLHPPGCKLQKLSAAADLLLGTTTHV